MVRLSFDEDYVLRPLDEVAAFVESNGHLPDVPNAEDVARDGVRLGEMNAVLLRKIEKLTLHTIALDRRIHELEAEVRCCATGRPNGPRGRPKW